MSKRGNGVRIRFALPVALSLVLLLALSTAGLAGSVRVYSTEALASAGAAEAITVSPNDFQPSVLEFAWKAGDPKPAAKTVLVTGVTEGYSYGASDGWISYSEGVNVPGGIQFTISVNPTGFTSPGVKEGDFSLTQEPSGVKFTLAIKLNIASVPVPVFDPPSLNFVWEKGGPNPASQVTVARNVGGVSYSSDKSWIRVASGNYANGGFQMNIQVNPAEANLDVGVHEGVVSLTTDGKTITLPVKLTVVSAEGTLRVNRQRLNFGGFLGSRVISQSVGIAYTGLNAVDWSASGPPWLTLTPANGSVAATAPTSVTVGVNTAAITQAGRYSGTLTITDQTTTYQIGVELFQVAPGSPTLQLFGLEVTQGIQNLLNDVPFIANRAVYVRGHVRSLTGQPIEKVTAELIATRNGAELGRLSPTNPGGSITAVGAPNRGQLNDSFLFEFPDEWRTGTLTVRFVGKSHPIACVDPAEKSSANGAANDCTVTLTFQSIPVMPVTYVLANDQGYVNGPNGQRSTFDFQANAAHASGTSAQLMAGMPLSGIDEQIFPTRLTFPGVRTRSEDNGTVLGQTSELRKKAGDPRRHFYAIFARYDTDNNPETHSQGGPGGVAVFPGFVGQGEFNAENPETGSLNVHEVAHNLGRDHVACGLPKGEIGDTAFPHPNQQISTAVDGAETYYGFNVNTKRIYPPTYKDVMSYCWPNWISPYNYKAIMERLKIHYNQPGVTTAATQVIAQAGDPILVVSGRITSTMAGNIESVEAANANAELSAPAEGDFSVRFLNASGAAIASYAAQPNLVDSHATGRYTRYAVVAPQPSGLARIQLLNGATVLDELVASANAPAIELSAPSGEEIFASGPVTISWAASDEDGDEVRYNVEYSTDDGVSWFALALDWPETMLVIDSAELPGSSQARVRVSANDGFLSTFAVSELFSVADKLPVAVILNEEINDYYVGGQEILLQGAGYDVEDGDLSDLTWYSDRDGLLGTGASLLLAADDLSEGPHIIVLEAKDSQGQSSLDDTTVEPPSAEDEASYDAVSFAILYDPLTLPAALAVGPNLGFFAVEGANEVLTDTLYVDNLGDGELSWTASSDADNVTFSNTSGDAPAEIVVSVDTTGLTYGLIEGELTFTPSDPDLESVVVDYFINVESVAGHFLTITTDGNGSGNVTSEPEGIDCGDTCSFAFNVNSTVILTATPDENSVFSGWSGGCEGVEEQCEVAIDAAKTVNATFDSFQSGNDKNIFMPVVRK